MKLVAENLTCTVKCYQAQQGAMKLITFNKRYARDNHRMAINYFSNPEVQDKAGETVGSVNANNAKHINALRFLLAANGDESESCPGY